MHNPLPVSGLSPLTQGVLDRFTQIKPKVIFSVEAVRYNGKVHDHMEKLRSVVAGEHTKGNLDWALPS